MVHFSLKMMTRFYPDFHIQNGTVSGMQIRVTGVGVSSLLCGWSAGVAGAGALGMVE